MKRFDELSEQAKYNLMELVDLMLAMDLSDGKRVAKFTSEKKDFLIVRLR